MSSSIEPTLLEPRDSIRGKVLIVDDESVIRWALRKTLQGMNFDIEEAETGEQAIALIRTIRFDAVLLDIGMPGMNGIETCREIRRLMPLLGIVMLTVKNAEDDKIRALDAGADDYVTKPFHIRELAARLRAAVRRTQAAESEEAAAIRIGEIELDPAVRSVKRAGEPIHLTPKEFELLYFLMSHAGVSLAHARILGAVWGPEYGGELEYLRTFVRQLRKKLGDDAASPKYVMTDAQVGYRFRANDRNVGGRE
ncbi:MAG TPA: response regulator transcription factor [Bryobacteraceae bacterium]|nr:response regulator transcription factor [Bryobacteraceae bacterium]